MSERLQKISVLFGSILLIGLLLAGGEIYCRFFTNINFLENSREMFVADKYGESYGNTPNFQGISFGETFETDENGFRYDSNFRQNAESAAALIVGDSVTFGPAVVEPETIAGIIRRNSDFKIYNASAIGYDTFDYQNVIAKVISQKPDIKKVLVFFCLNDVNNLSAKQIRKQVNTPQKTEEQTDDSVLRPVNDYLRSRSKLYLWLKNLLRDTQMIYFKNDLSQYQQGDKYVENALQPLSEIKKSLDARNISFEVFVLPYEAQLREGNPAEYLQPQQMVDAYLRKNNIPFADLTREFQKQPNEKELFLYGDPMHLSVKGSQLAANAVCAETKDICR